MIRKYDYLIIGLGLSTSVILADANKKEDTCPTKEYYDGVDLGIGGWKSFGNDGILFSGTISAYAYGTSCGHYGGKLVFYGTYGSTDSSSIKKDYLLVRDDNKTEIGVAIDGAGIKQWSVMFLVGACKNFIIQNQDKEKHANKNKSKQKCARKDQVNAFFILGGVYEKISRKNSVAKAKAWIKNEVKDFLLGIGVDGFKNYKEEDMFVIPSLSILLELFGNTKVFGYDLKGSIENNIDLSRGVRPLFFAEVKVVKRMSKAFYLGVTPLLKLCFRSMNDNSDKLGKLVSGSVKSASDISDILESNMLFGIELTLMYVM